MEEELFLKLFQQCPVCKNRNHIKYLRKFYKSRDPRKIKLREKLKELIKVPLKFIKFRIGIPCCNCFKEVFLEDPINDELLQEFASIPVRLFNLDANKQEDVLSTITPIFQENEITEVNLNGRTLSLIRSLSYWEFIQDFVPLLLNLSHYINLSKLSQKKL